MMENTQWHLSGYSDNIQPLADISARSAAIPCSTLLYSEQCAA
jgi:hypothetical protein